MSAIKAAGVKISLLEKQLYLEKEKMMEYKEEVKDEMESMKKKASMKEKHLLESRALVSSTLSHFQNLEKMCNSLGSTVTAKQLVTDLKATMEELTPRLIEETKKMNKEKELEKREKLTLAKKKALKARRSSAFVPMVLESAESKSSLIDDIGEEEDEVGELMSLHDAPTPTTSPLMRKAYSAPQAATTNTDPPSQKEPGHYQERRRSNTAEWVNEGREASREEMDVLIKEIYVMMCGSTNNADANAKDQKRDVSLESFMTQEEFLRFVTLANLVDANLTMPRVEALFNSTVRSSSRGAKKFSKRIQYDDFGTVLQDMADIKYPYGNGAKSAMDTMMTDFVWPVRSRLKIKQALSSRQENRFEKDWLKPEVMTFFNNQNAPLMNLFKRYSNMSSKTDTAGHRGAMPLDQFCQFCLDYEITPALLSQTELMEAVHFIVGKKLHISFTDFIQCLAKLAEQVHSGEDTPTFLSKVQALFHDIDRSGSIFKLSREVKQKEQERRTSTMGKLQLAGGKEQGRRVSQMSQKRISNVNKLFMMDM
ncbi:hypothetical protein TL16_g00621 [Triparma laevis f. inornata]|uniref:Uncharacterized protein n=2 Tax=Triparma laevis TaxID=1534972 RepID=A0A9W7KYW4_9STRA|nr:hypothetical protein TL16_g00621 [Triparma laevis f. inornata]GMI16265.1 hypothetical protein TrLO_g11922 [Triparma laevis f. longispina]